MRYAGIPNKHYPFPKKVVKIITSKGDIKMTAMFAPAAFALKISIGGMFPWLDSHYPEIFTMAEAASTP